MKRIRCLENENKHIVLLINSMGEGGAQRVLLSLVEEYLTYGIAVTVICLSRNDFYELPPEVNRVYLHANSRESSKFCETVLVPYYAWKLKKYVNNENLKIVQSHLFRANYVNILSKLFYSKQLVQIVNHSVVSRFFKEGISGKVNLLLIRFLYPKADKILFISKRMKEDFLRYVKNIETKNNTIIYNPYNISKILGEIDLQNKQFIFNQSKSYCNHSG